MEARKTWNSICSSETAASSRGRLYGLDVERRHRTTTFALAADDAEIDGVKAITGDQRLADGPFGLYAGFTRGSPVQFRRVPFAKPFPLFPGESYAVSLFWLTSVAYKGTTTPNEFQATWNGNTLAPRTNKRRRFRLDQLSIHRFRDEHERDDSNSTTATTRIRLSSINDSSNCSR